jgi:predicted MFS family arabinose efflux permease
MLPGTKQATLALWLLALNFTLSATSFNSIQNLTSEVYDQLNYTTLGKFGIFSLYSAMCVGNFFAGKIIRHLGYKKAIFYSSFFALFVNGANLMTVSCKNFPDLFWCDKHWIISVCTVIGNALYGGSAAVYWGAQSGYVTSISTLENRGSYFGIFNSVVNSSQLTSSIFSAFLLRTINQFAFFCVLTVIVILSCFLFSFQPESTLIAREDTLQQSESRELEKQDENVMENVKMVFSALSRKKLRPLLYIFFFSGVTPSVYITFLYRLVRAAVSFETDEELNSKTAYVLIMLGIGEMMGGFLMGKMCDKFKRTFIHQFLMSLVECAIFFSLICCFVPNYLYCFIMAFFWGWTDVSTLTMIPSVIMKDFPGALEIFAVYLTMQCIGTMVGTLLSILLQNLSTYYFVSALAVVQMTVCYKTLEYYLRSPSDDAKKSELAMKESTGKI